MMKICKIVLSVILTCHIPTFGQDIRDHNYKIISDFIYIDKGFNFRNENSSDVVNEQTIIKFLSRYPDAIIEEVFSGNKFALADLFIQWIKRKYPEESFFWESRGYKLGYMLRFNPEILLETIPKNNKKMISSIAELLCSGRERYRSSAMIYLLKSRIKCLHRINEPELMEIKTIILTEMRNKLSSIESGDFKQNESETVGKGQTEKNFEANLKELIGLVPKPILNACSDVQKCPCQNNIKSLLKALKEEKDKEILSSIMKIYSFERYDVFVFSGVLDLLQEEALAGSNEAIEVLLYFYLYGDDKLREFIASENFAPLVRVRPRAFLEIINKNRSMFYAVPFPVDSVSTLPRISEVCEYFLTKRLDALNKVKDKDLISVKNACISLIKRKIEEINRSSQWEKISKGIQRIKY